MLGANSRVQGGVSQLRGLGEQRLIRRPRALIAHERSSLSFWLIERNGWLGCRASQVGRLMERLRVSIGAPHER